MKNDGYEEICKHTLAILISQLRRFAVSDFQLFPSFHPSKECALVKRYLDSHYSDDINLEQLASLSHLNKYYLSHEFTRYYGISPISYLTHRRIEVCKNLLENTDHEISDIAHLAGFSSQSYLAQSFRKYCGMTAGEYRRSKKIKRYDRWYLLSALLSSQFHCTKVCVPYLSVIADCIL